MTEDAEGQTESILQSWTGASVTWRRNYFNFFTFFDLSLLYSEPKDLFFFQLIDDSKNREKTRVVKEVHVKRLFRMRDGQ